MPASIGLGSVFETPRDSANDVFVRFSLRTDSALLIAYSMLDLFIFCLTSKTAYTDSAVMNFDPLSSISGGENMRS